MSTTSSNKRASFTLTPSSDAAAVESPTVAAADASAAGATGKDASSSSSSSSAAAAAAAEPAPRRVSQMLELALEDILDNGLEETFRELTQSTRSSASHHTFNAARDRANNGKNRYSDVLPFDLTRVKIERETGDNNTDYINANHIKFPQVNRHYIAAQGPTASTQIDFWHMIWQQGVQVVVMTSNLVEKGAPKCHCYYPSTVDETLVVGPYHIKLVAIETSESQSDVTRTLSVHNELTGASREIVHHHFVAWPDHGVPKSADHVLDYLRRVRLSAQRLAPEMPILIHCSAGIGRTGTFLVIDVCLELFERKRGATDIEILTIIREARLQRTTLVQTADQLEFCYTAVTKGVRELEIKFAEEDELAEAAAAAAKAAAEAAEAAAATAAAAQNQHDASRKRSAVPIDSPHVKRFRSGEGSAASIPKIWWGIAALTVAFATIAVVVATKRRR
ncbi:protein tyrosine phosphatase [Capsaspora owczarzaki ATCC 30864]|uniref:Protein tyrosine phosphatase, variant n=1 Tax=Capsaspora owczarzaki (strain ATCC 30864) TaxID=595528 RepID=A0A0D2WK66_CAPO3|nr:protein tyrosine phosphatase [Capsaspora owczarzaki ATCC 30864]KJE90580.1 protein tyrosine phosphatase, variant [Capsaspora owczarzaki ATCC 30864]|eukprot:XP_004364744.1 protein tyrosine phosphatase [Capsaspora owczarzaki ATCC 30864]